MRKIINIKILSLFILLTVLFSGVVVSADTNKPDLNELSDYVYVNDIKELRSASYLFKFDAPKTFAYNFNFMWTDPYEISGIKTPVIELYDKDLNLVKSSDNTDLSIFLNEGTYYIYIYTPNGEDIGYAPFQIKYDYKIIAKIKEPNSSEYKDLTRTGWFSSSSLSGKWDYYAIPANSDVTLGMTVNNLPSGQYDFGYEWYLVKDNKDTLIKKDSTISQKFDSTGDKLYKCKITDKKSSFSFVVYFEMEAEKKLAFTDGTSIDFEFKAFRPSEERVSVLKPIDIVEGQKVFYNFYYYYEYGDYSYGYSIKTTDSVTIRPESKGVCFFHSAYVSGGASVGKDMYYFVFDDGAGEKITCDKKYHISKETNVNEYNQVIYSFTPEKDGVYTFFSSNKTLGDPMVVVFDSDRNVVCYDDDGEYDYWDNPSLFESMGSFDTRMISDCKAEAQLTAGKTYYIAIPIIYRYLDCDFSVSLKGSNSGLSFGDFVERLYVVALNRQSEKEGKDYWCELVGNGTLSGADCARFFLTSPEFKGRNLSDEDFLKVLYSTFFDRNAADDPDGFNFWMNSLKSVGKDTVVEGFINSPEWCNICADYGVRSGAPTAKATKASKNATAFATRLYTECLGREPEEGGLNYWSLGLTNQELTGSQAAHEFFYCQEFNDHNFDNKELLTRMYKTFMGREPDTDGLNYRLNNMNNGMTKDQVFNSFVQSQEFTDICASYAITR